MDELLAKLERRAPLAGLLGYVNFGTGKPDAHFRRGLSEAYAVIEQQGEARPWLVLHSLLRSRLRALSQTEAAFRDSSQAEDVLDLVFLQLLPAYRQHHQDLLFHQSEADLFTPYFIAVAMEAVLEQGGPWKDSRLIVAGAIGQLNDFVGHRPIAILESRPRGEPYEHERVRPLPLWLRGAGPAWGRYRELVGQALEILSETEPALLNKAGFDLEALEELACDPRAYDHGHPANRRPNYVFGEWDPHQIDGQGRYRRYVVRQVTLDGLLDRVNHTPDSDRSELLFEGAAVLAGTILMGTGISGTGPGSHDSSVTLATLMPRIARLRDQFYAGLLERMRGPQADRLRAEAQATRQPFGGIRQHLNQFLARHRAAQLQQRHLALFYADLGYAEASRTAAASIPAASMRMLSEMHSRIRTGHLHIDRGEFADAIHVLQGLVEFLQRGIACGALLDPWNILGFQGLFPLSSAREDSIRDPRVDELVELLDAIFHVCSRLIAEMAAAGQLGSTQMVRAVLQQLAQWWDRFATVEVTDVRRLHGGEIVASTDHLANTLARWHERGETAADLAFWREHLEGFQTPKAFAQVVEALLRKQDYRAAMALLMNWLGHADHVSLEEESFSFHALAIRWMWNWTRSAPAAAGETWPLAVRFLDYLEANAEDFWQVPSLFQDEIVPPNPADPDEDLFDAAYEGVTFQDSADDHQEGSILEGSAEAERSDLEAEAELLGPRLRFLSTSARLWQIVARLDACAHSDEKRRETLLTWLTAARKRLVQLGKLIDTMHAHPVPTPLGSYESLVDYDRRRVIKEQLLHTAIASALDTWNACLALAGAVGRPVETGADDFVDGLPWQIEAIALEQSLLRGEREKSAEHLAVFMERFQGERLLYTGLGDGGEPRQILRARLAQSLLRRLALALPRLGLIREAFHLLKMVQVLEQTHVGGRKGITEFNELFRAAYEGAVEAALATALSVPDALDVVALLEGLTRPFLQMWIDHSQTLQLSTMESFASEEEFAPLAAFVQEYGGELFHAKFLTMANLRGTLHRGVDAYLDSLNENEDAGAAPRLLHDLGGKVRRADAVRWITCVLQAIVENYEEYKDYNTTTPQSDYGENLYLLLDFLRLKSAYDRQAWRLKPLFLAHGTLARKGHAASALAWQSAFAGLTEELSGQFVERLKYLEQIHGIRLRTVADRIGEQFTRPLALDRVCALVEPAMVAAGPEGASPAFDALTAAIEPLASNPSGVGLDVPHWLRRLEAEVERVRSRATHAGTLPEDTLRVRRAVLSVDDLRRQLESWDTPLLGQPPPTSGDATETPPNG